MIMDTAEPEYYGRVMSINMLTFSAMPLMAYPMGQIADAFGVRPTFVAEGLIIVGFMLLAAMWNPSHVFGRAPRRSMEVVPGAETALAADVELVAPAGGG